MASVSALKAACTRRRKEVKKICEKSFVQVVQFVRHNFQTTVVP